MAFWIYLDGSCVAGYCHPDGEATMDGKILRNEILVPFKFSCLNVVGTCALASIHAPAELT